MPSRDSFYREDYRRSLRALFGVSGTRKTFFEADTKSETTSAPPAGGTRLLSGRGMVERNLTLVADGETLTEGVHYIEHVGPQGEAGFENLSIPEGTQVTAEYFTDPDVPDSGGAEPVEEEGNLSLLSGWTGYADCYRDRTRVWLSGLISAGTADEETPLFSLPAGYSPRRSVLLSTLSGGGPATVRVTPSGEAQIGPSPFVCEEWLTLEGLSFRIGSAFLTWGDENLHFGDEELDVPYSELL